MRGSFVAGMGAHLHRWSGRAVTSSNTAAARRVNGFRSPGDASAASDMLSFVSSTTHTVLTITICMTLIALQVGSGIVSRQLQRVHIQSRAVRGIVGVHVGVVAYSVTLQCSMDAEAAVVVIDARPGDLIIHGQAWRAVVAGGSFRALRVRSAAGR